MPPEILFWFAAILAAIFVGMSKGGLPIIGMLGVPILSLVVNPVMAAGLLLPVYVVSDVFGLYAYRSNFDRRVLAILIPAAAIGIAFGWATASFVPERLVTALVGLIGLVFSANLLLRKSMQSDARTASVGPGLFWGALTGFTSFVSHAGAPPYQVYVLPLKLSKAVFAGTSTILFAAINAMKLVPYYFLGQLSGDNLKTAAYLMVPAALAVFAGFRLVKILPEKLFFSLVTWALLAISLQLLWKAYVG
jgi:uncharacterized protein